MLAIQKVLLEEISSDSLKSAANFSIVLCFYTFCKNRSKTTVGDFDVR